MSVPAFIDLAEKDQAAELRIYLKSLGAEISEESSPDGLLSDLHQIIGAVNICFDDSVPPEHAESALNSLISLLLIIPATRREELVLSFCEKIAKTEKETVTRIRVLSNLFYGLEERSTLKYSVYSVLVKVAGQADMLNMVPCELNQVKKWIALWDVSNQKAQNLLRVLYDAFMNSKQSETAGKVMIELLGTYTEENASQAREDAQKCILTSLSDPSTFLMDHLLTLKPVKFLEGAPIHDLLTVFVSGKLTDYLQFYATNKNFIESSGLSHEQNMQKMRLLTFMQLAETRKEIDFPTIQQEMSLGEDEVEAFIIEVVKTQAVRVRIDQIQQKVIISSTTHRTFGKQQWQLLHEQLKHWQGSLIRVRNSLQTLQQQS